MPEVAREPIRPARFIIPVAVSAGLVLSAPFVGQVRAYIRQTFPGHFVLVVGMIIAIGLSAALVTALLRIRDRRLRRFGAIGLAIAIAAVYAVRNASDNPESNVVELFHFLQYGLVAFLFYRAWRPLGDLSIVLLPALAGLIVGTVEEWFQWFIPNRVGEMKDVLLNLVAIGTGLLFSLAVSPPDERFTTLRPGSQSGTGLMAVAALLVFAAFFHVVHLGHRVVDDDIGSFASRYSRDRLLALQQDRKTQWRDVPPPGKLVRLSREDQYLTEGIQHVRWRNRLWDSGDARGTWLENQILEKYYAPVLDTPTHEGAGHQWPAVQHTDAESRASAVITREPYVSAAYPYELYFWPRWLFWSATALVAAAMPMVVRKAQALL